MTELTINFIFKFVHIFGLMLGAASGFGSMFVARQLRRGPTPELAAMRPFFGKLGLYGIGLLWVSGLALWVMRYDMAHLGPVFDTKMLVAMILLVVIAIMNIAFNRAKKASTPPPAWLPKLGMTTPVLTLLAVALAVWVFV